MASNYQDPTLLNQCFHYKSATHRYNIKWCQLGRPDCQPVVFVHGTPWSSRVWKPFALALARQYHVYLFDNPGFGQSPLEEKLEGTSFEPSNEVERLDADLSRQSEAFAALYKMWESSWGGKKPHVIAHDHGGLMSLRAYLNHDCQFASMCLVDVVAIGPFGQPLFKTVAEHPELIMNLPNSVFEGILESYIRDASFRGISKETMQMLKEPWMREGGKAAFIRQLCQANSRSTERVEEKYGNVGEKMPINIIWGDQDEWIPVETARRLADALGTDQVVRIEDAGHLIMYDQPVALAVELASWLISVVTEPVED